MKELLLLFAVISTAVSQVPLEKYNIDPTSLTVSGISSGACFATQYHVAFSTEVKGAATFAGIVYNCANGVVVEALVCASSPGLINVPYIIGQTSDMAANGKIDPTGGMAGDKVFIFQGSIDTVVDPGNAQNIQEFYTAFNADIATEYTIQAEHCQPTDFYGPACTFKGGEYINDCAYNGAYEVLNYMYDNTLQRPSSPPLTGQFLMFDQREFFPLNSPGTYSVDTTGYIYVPSGCVDKTQTCKLHVAFHGCLQGREHLGDSFARNTGYLEVGEVNNVITLFPQISDSLLTNPQGCWDWWGYTGVFAYNTKQGNQMDGVHQMIDRLIYG